MVEINFEIRSAVKIRGRRVSVGRKFQNRSMSRRDKTPDDVQGGILPTLMRCGWAESGKRPLRLLKYYFESMGIAILPDHLLTSQAASPAAN